MKLSKVTKFHFELLSIVVITIIEDIQRRCDTFVPIKLSLLIVLNGMKANNSDCFYKSISPRNYGGHAFMFLLIKIEDNLSHVLPYD